jgi:transposase
LNITRGTNSVAPKHPLRVIRRIADAVLAGMSRRFATAYAPIGRPSIAPEKLLRALLLQALYTIRSERQLMERIDFDLLFRWFVGLGIDDAVWDASTFAKNRDRFLEMDAAAEVLTGVVNHPDVRRQMSRDHFSVDGTLIDAWASMKSFRRKDGGDDGPAGPGRNAERDIHGEKRSNETHASTTDPDARLYRKSRGQPSRLC